LKNRRHSLLFFLLFAYCEGMKSESSDASIKALKNLISEADLILSTTEPLPEGRTPRCRELLSSALALADDLLKQERTKPAAALGHKGGSATARRHGPEHYRRMAAARKTRSGGRPRKKAT
jgi:NAD(P)H-dependent FMN reductase